MDYRIFPILQNEFRRDLKFPHFIEISVVVGYFYIFLVYCNGDFYSFA